MYEYLQSKNKKLFKIRNNVLYGQDKQKIVIRSSIFDCKKSVNILIHLYLNTFTKLPVL